MKLQMCPFCAGNNLKLGGRCFSGSYRGWVICLDCRAKGPLAPSPEEASIWWNCSIPIQKAQGYTAMSTELGFNTK